MDTIRLSALMLSAAVALGACSGDNAPERSSASDPTSGTGADFTAANLRADLPVVGLAWRDSLPFYFSDSDNERLYTVTQQATAQCMAGKGFNYIPINYPENSTATDRVNPLDEGYAQARGYHELPVEIIDANSYDDSAFNNALEGECATQAAALTYGANEELILQVDQALSSFDGAIHGFDDSSEGQSANAEWSSCMDTAGYSYERPLDARLEFAENPDISPKEIEVRLADYDCDVETGLTQARHDWEQGRFDTWMAENEGLVQELAGRHDAFESRLVQSEATVAQG